MNVKKNKAKKVGRPTKLNAETLRKGIINAIKEGRKLDDVAAQFEVARFTLFRWFKKDPEFGAAIKEAKAVIDDEVEENFLSRTKWVDVIETREVLDPRGNIVELKVKKRLPPDPNVMRTWLQFRKPDEWGFKAGQGIEEEQELDPVE